MELDAYQTPKVAHQVEMRERRLEATPLEVESGLSQASQPLHPQITYAKDGLTYASILQSGLSHAIEQYRLLFTKSPLQNALLSTCVVALAQQLCGSKSCRQSMHNLGPIQPQLMSIVNVFAFYSSRSPIFGFTKICNLPARS